MKDTVSVRGSKFLQERKEAREIVKKKYWRIVAWWLVGASSKTSITIYEQQQQQQPRGGTHKYTYNTPAAKSRET